jgi:hypothetical protein
MFSTLPALNCVKPPSKPLLGDSKLPQCMNTFCLFSDYYKRWCCQNWTNPILFTNKWNAHAHVHFLTEVLIIGYDVRWLDMHTSQYWKASKMDSTTQNTKRWWVISLTEVIMNLSTVEQNKTTPRWLKCCCMTLSAPLSSRYCRFFRYSKKGPMT